MKRFLFTLSLILVSATAIISLCSWNYAPLEPASHNSANITAEDDWILIGEVTLSNYNGIGKIKANLYVREIAKKCGIDVKTLSDIPDKVWEYVYDKLDIGEKS